MGIAAPQLNKSVQVFQFYNQIEDFGSMEKLHTVSKVAAES